MEQIMSNRVANSTSLIVIICELIILNLVIIVQDFYSSFRYILRTLFDVLVAIWNVWWCSESNTTVNAEVSTQKLCSIKNIDGKKLSRVELEMAMEKLGNLCDPNELAGLFEEEEPCMQEVKEAFNFFDENGDGFIDARELNKVLTKLGFKMASSEMECKSMIRTFDDNEDGRIDFDEFVKLVEKSFW